MSDDATVDQTRRLHEALERLVDLREGELLGCWLVIYETVRLDDGPPAVGHHYGPETVPVWRALGLLEWQRASVIGMVGLDDELEEDGP
jgi:hypothetical protein